MMIWKILELYLCFFYHIQRTRGLTTMAAQSKAVPFLKAPEKLDGSMVGDFGTSCCNNGFTMRKGSPNECTTLFCYDLQALTPWESLIKLPTLSMSVVSEITSNPKIQRSTVCVVGLPLTLLSISMASFLISSCWAQAWQSIYACRFRLVSPIFCPPSWRHLRCKWKIV